MMTRSNDTESVESQTDGSEPATSLYPSEDRSGERIGMYCEYCGTIFYVPRSVSDEVYNRDCAICGVDALRWITPGWQSEGEGL